MTSDLLSPTRSESDVDLWAEDSLRNPLEAWRELRETGPAVWLRGRNVWAIPRYDGVREVLADDEVFSSSNGVGLNPLLNEAMAGTTIASDGPFHEHLRGILRRPMSPRELRKLAPDVEQEAVSLVDRLLERGTFDAVTDLAQHLPVTIVAERVGLPDDIKDRMLEWGLAAFNSFGPADAPRTVAAADTLTEAYAWGHGADLESQLKPGGWAAALWEAAANGELSPEQCPLMVTDYWGPSLDTTISATASAVWFFAQNPDQWQLLRQDPTLVIQAIDETLRLVSPISYFTRVATRDRKIDGQTIPAGDRVMVMYGSANRDERKYSDSETFDITRKAGDHMAFGHGAHSCAGQPLARLELRALLTALAARVESFECLSAEPLTHNWLRGFVSMPVRMKAA